MENWVPNPYAKPYIPKKKSKIRQQCGLCLTCRKHFSCLCKACFLLSFAATLFINISFIFSQKSGLNFMQDSSHDSQRSQNQFFAEHDQTDIHRPVIPRRSIVLDVLSNKSSVYVKVNGKTIYYNNETTDHGRGIHVIVLNQATGQVMAKNLFDTYLSNEDDAMVQFLEKLSLGRIIVFTLKDEGSFQMKDKCRQVLTDLGSQHAKSLAWRDSWAFVTVNGKKAYGEVIGKSPDFGSWGDLVQLKVNITLTSMEESVCPGWPKKESMARRRYFCSKYEGYGDVCHCVQPAPIEFLHKPLPDGGILNVAVSVIASNRPQYLFRMLKTLIQTPGVPINNVTVFIDGFYDEPKDVAQLFNIKAIQHTPHGVKNSRISQHYKASITATFERFPGPVYLMIKVVVKKCGYNGSSSDYIILIEEDLDVSPDFFYYFKQTMPILEEDPTLYCISAWNDQGYEHSCKDPTLLYRIETMPGLGWMMKKSLFKDELLPQWPSVDKQWDWDMWMRHDMIRKDRECIIPDVSRTYHFGSKGLNINPYFQQLYFTNHKIQKKPDVRLKDVDRMKSAEYEQLIEGVVQQAKVLDHSKDPCADDFIPEVNAETFVMYIHMNSTTDFQTWKQLAKCYKLWDLDVRGFHKSMWRQFHKDKHLVIVGVPASPYSKFKPSDVKPIYLEEKKDKDLGR